MKNEALHYAKIGLKIIPVNQNKTPRTRHGSHDASNDPALISRWFCSYSTANVAIVTGRANNIVLIDLDEHDDEDIHGKEVLNAWEAVHGQLPDTLMSLSGGGGVHMVYRMTEKYNGYTNAQPSDENGKHYGVDIRGEGGYFVAAPSIHENGHAYEWEASTIAGDDVELSDIAEVNEIVDAFIQFVYSLEKSKSNGGEGTCQRFEVPDVIMEGVRTSTLFKATCSLIARGFHEKSIRLAISSENEIRCKPPLTDKELEKEVFKAFKRGYKASTPYTNKGRELGWNSVLQAGGEGQYSERSGCFKRTEDGKKCRSFISPISQIQHKDNASI